MLSILICNKYLVIPVLVYRCMILQQSMTINEISEWFQTKEERTVAVKNGINLIGLRLYIFKKILDFADSNAFINIGEGLNTLQQT